MQMNATQMLGGDKSLSSGALSQEAESGKEQFLALLVAQISNQNPLNPMDDKDMVAQLAQFSGVEQAIETNKKLDTLAAGQSAANHLALSGLVGKQAVAETGTLHVGENQGGGAVAFVLQNAAARTNVRILDGQNNLVHTLQADALPAGVASLQWDGRNSQGGRTGPGDYRVEVDAVDYDGNKVPAKTSLQGKVTSVDLRGDEPMAQIGSARVRLRDISQLSN